MIPRGGLEPGDIFDSPWKYGNITDWGSMEILLYLSIPPPYPCAPFDKKKMTIKLKAENMT